MSVYPQVTGDPSHHPDTTFSVKVHVKEFCKLRCVIICEIYLLTFRSDNLHSDLIKHPYKTASLLSHQYYATLRNFVDKHALVKQKDIPKHPNTGFMSTDILAAIPLKISASMVTLHLSNGSQKIPCCCRHLPLHS